MNKQIFTVALLAGSLASVSTLPAQDNRRSNTRQATVEDRLDQLEQNVADLQERVKRLEEGQQPGQQPARGPAPPPQSSGSNQRTRERTQSSGEQQSFDVFYQGLQSGGHWFNDPTYGEIWQPDVASSDANWRPYSDGHWAYTDRGWTWISNEDFGWATYHYGRWARRSDTGWVWIPGSRWAPAWVSWRESTDHVGWAPLPPEVADDSQVRIEGWVDNYYDIGPAAYLFVKIGDLSRPSYRDVIVPPANNVEFFTRTKNVTDIVYGNDLVAVNGPRYEQIASQAKIPSYKLNYVTGNEGRFGINTKGDQLEVMAPSARLQTSASVQPKVEKTLGQAQMDRGWQEVDKQKAAQLKQAIEQQAPVPASVPPKAAASKSQNQPAQTGRQQPSTSNPPAPEVSPQGQKSSATQQAGEQPPRPQASPAEAGRMESPAPEKARQTGRATSGEANAPREETRQPGKPSPAPEQREQKEQPAKPVPTPAEESKGRGPTTEQAPRREQQATEPRREQPATEKRSETNSRAESQREQPARKEEPSRKEEPVRREETAPRREEPPVRKEESSEPRQRPDAERRVEEKQPGRQSSESSRTEKKEPKQEKSKKEESPLQQ
jgi:hypothetical protein